MKYLLVINDMHLEFDSDQERKIWWLGLQFLILNESKDVKNYKKKSLKDEQYDMANQIFMQADKDGNKELNKKEVQKTLRDLHISFTDKVLSKLLSEFDYDKSGTIGKQEFFLLIKSLMKKKELQKLFLKYAIY